MESVKTKNAKDNDIVIEVKDLKKYFEDVKAVDGISFKIKRGECFGFLGPNGAGKTTTINVLACYLKPTSGNAFVSNYDVVKEATEVKKKIGISPQENIFYEELTVYENVMFFGKMYTIDSIILKQRANDLIQKVGLEEKRKTKAEKLSGGMMKRLNLIIGLVHDPEILFLDEPTAGLDPQTRRLIWDYIFDLKKRDKTIFLTTHYMDEADVLSDRLAIIDHGKIIAEGTPEHLKETIGKGDILSLKIEGETDKIKGSFDELKQNDYILDVFYDEEEMETKISAMDGVGRIGKIIKHFTKNELQVIDVGVQRNSLENVFLTLTGRSLRE
ncbi:MAG: ABC transporter ATP-binding protein [Candidatus Thorarchaeota archaeon]